MNIPEIKFPNLDPDFIKNPYPHLKILRESSPLHKDINSDLVLVTRFEDVKGVQTSKAFSSSEPQDLHTFKKTNESEENYPYFWKTEEFSLLNLEGSVTWRSSRIGCKSLFN
jgi:cytochrome P450